MKKFLWLSRHELTREQTSGLAALGYAATETVNPGIIQDAARIVSLAAYHEADGVGLVAPGRIWVALISARPATLEVYEAESRQAPELRVGDGPIPFAHVAWHRVMGDGICCDAGEADPALESPASL